jgi:hypothetical protein
VKECLDEDGENSDDESVEVDPYDDPSPVLLLGHNNEQIKTDLF